jgi:hypothetical protein
MAAGGSGAKSWRWRGMALKASENNRYRRENGWHGEKPAIISVAGGVNGESLNNGSWQREMA